MTFNRTNEQALLEAIYSNDTDTVTTLLSKDDYRNLTIRGYTLLYYALHAANSEMVNHLLKNGADLFYAKEEDEAYDSRESIPSVYFLIQKFDNDFVRQCLKNLDVNKIIDKDGGTLLHFVAIKGLRESLIPLLVGLGINPDAKNDYGYTALNCAKIFKRNHILDILEHFKALTYDVRSETALYGY